MITDILAQTATAISQHVKDNPRTMPPDRLALLLSLHRLTDIVRTELEDTTGKPSRVTLEALPYGGMGITIAPPPKRPYAVYVNLDKRQYKVRIHIRPCGEIRKNKKPENEKHYWREFETLEEAIVFADQTAYEHGLSPWTENKCGCEVNQRGIYDR